MIRLALLATLFAPIALAAQQIELAGAGSRPSAAAIREALAEPHVVIGGSGRLDLPRDTTITSTIIVVGRPTYLASTVRGSVIVIGGDLFLHPGVNVSGRAVAIGGTVATTMLGQVHGGTASFPDETYASATQGQPYRLTYQDLRQHEAVPTLELAGLQGVLIPAYDRVDGLALPVGITANLGGGMLRIEPRLTYVSRIGTIDPAVSVDVNPEGVFGLTLFGGRGTRSNDKWVDGDLINSASDFFLGNDSRNYFRSTRAEGRAFYRPITEGWTIAPYVGARTERIRSITNAGNVFSFLGRNSIEKQKRPNPSVEEGDISSGLLGAEFADTAGMVLSHVHAELEQAFSTMTGTSRFTQLTLDAGVGFPTFGTQTLHFRGHAVLTQGDSTPRARYAYLGGGGTLPVVDQLELGGDRLVFLESKYLIPVDAVNLPFIGVPVVGLWHMMGTAGAGTLPRLEQELRVSLKLSIVSFYFTTDVGGSRGSEIGAGLSFR